MGYTTEFEGRFNLMRPLSDAEDKYLRMFAETRRMARDPDLLQNVSDSVRKAVGLPLGPEGAYFVGGTGFAGQDRMHDIIDYNMPPDGQPGLWCKWVPTEDRRGLEWSGMEKFYDYAEWLDYLIVRFLKPWGHTLNGKVAWQGEESDDQGTLVVRDNVVYSMPRGGPIRTVSDVEPAGTPGYKCGDRAFLVYEARDSLAGITEFWCENDERSYIVRTGSRGTLTNVYPSVLGCAGTGE